MLTDSAIWEFHVSRDARDRYQFDQTLFALRGNVIFANFHAARLFAQKMNGKRDLINYPEQAVRAGQINAMGLIDEIFHYILRQYCQQRNPHVMKEALIYLESTLGKEAVNTALSAFVDTFPPTAVYQRQLTTEAYLAGVTENIPHRQVALEEMLLLWLANLNPALSPFLELFDDAHLEKTTVYPQIMQLMQKFFDTQPFFGPDNENLIAMLRRPALTVPHSIQGQLDYIRTHWLSLLGEYLYRLLSSMDLLTEEEKIFFGFGPGPAQVYEFGGLDVEPENFSPDLHWMPQLVLVAKNAYVWLDQLSKKYQRTITQLDQIPDAELDTLAQWGITGLWLIGLWQRSTASKRIKQIMGNPEAVASAYSLDEYRIADDLGGEAAYNILKQQTWQRGIRMASDMVPNHVGIDARWVVEHPNWFIGLNYSPFPTYTFNGENLSNDPRVGIYLEDHYYSRNDAAVVFKRVDHWTGDTQYIYHGNDGTSMPWNDTAQLDYLNPEAREAVIQAILDVARRSPIIRFDAAMTLTKRHYQRLWFPEPGTGGDIPSRADFGMTKSAFDAAMPEEFWREVVDRVAVEAPDTLLLAEAFWLMEGYFVRTLGMHRVYNSAFMNMMRDEKNGEYRQLIKNTLEFDPQILKRYVNFMNNPDERTAVDQFGKGDKYFGICTMLITLPGLPMFGHGQIEGFSEKYGMEFRRAYWDETPDPWLVERHERQIFPLAHKRYLFAEVDNFLLYDFFTATGNVDENVFAYSNARDGERSLVLYHNKYAETAGWVRISAAYAVKDEHGEKRLVQRSLMDGLNIPNDPNTYLIFRDMITGLQYIRNCQQIVKQGLYAQLRAYEVQVFSNFYEVYDNEWRQYTQLATYLNGRGVPSIDEALKELFLAPVHTPFRRLVNAGNFQKLMNVYATSEDELLPHLEQVELDLRNLLDAVRQTAADTIPIASETNVPEVAREVREKLSALLILPTLLAAQVPTSSEVANAAVDYILTGLKQPNITTWGILLSWLFTHALGKVVTDTEESTTLSRSWVDEWLLGKLISQTLGDLELDEDAARRAVATVKLMLRPFHIIRHSEMAGYQRPPDVETQIGPSLYQSLYTALREQEVQAYLHINRYQGILWFNKESFEQLLWWIALIETLELIITDETTFTHQFLALYARVEKLLMSEAASDYQVAKLLDATK
ncbi:MAG: alpha-amylase [Anaerolineae bacterium]|nr:alpha-amylase [Anaerolineae bacterium]